jgi:hypothetical protein
LAEFVVTSAGFVEKYYRAYGGAPVFPSLRENIMRKVTYALLALALPHIALAQTAPSTPPPPPCAAPEYNEFDFWVGDWDVYPNGANQLVAHSKIEKLYSNCAVRENWMPLKGGTGGSLNSYDPATKSWHQTWIGSQPGHVEFAGGFTGGKMVLTGNWRNVNGPGQDALIRMTYSKNADGSVRQHGEQSTDHGLTWTNSFDFIYRKKALP